MDLHVRYEGDDDPDKRTARRLAQQGHATLHRSVRDVPSGLVLNPYAEQALSPADREAERGEASGRASGEERPASRAPEDRLVALDCSWETAEAEVFDLPGPHRALPFLVSGNPVNFGTPFQLNTAEAFAGALAILGEYEQAEAIMDEFSWGHTFLELNEEPLRRYSACADSAEVVAVQEEYMVEESD